MSRLADHVTEANLLDGRLASVLYNLFINLLFLLDGLFRQRDELRQRLGLEILA